MDRTMTVTEQLMMVTHKGGEAVIPGYLEYVQPEQNTVSVESYNANKTLHLLRKSVTA